MLTAEITVSLSVNNALCSVDVMWLWLVMLMQVQLQVISRWVLLP